MTMTPSSILYFSVMTFSDKLLLLLLSHCDLVQICISLQKPSVLWLSLTLIQQYY